MIFLFEKEHARKAEVVNQVERTELFQVLPNRKERSAVKNGNNTVFLIFKI